MASYTPYPTLRCTSEALGLFLGDSAEESVFALQLFLIALAVPVLLLAASVDQLRSEEQTTRARRRDPQGNAANASLS
jgi:hypothetical protein